uniref:Zinc finger protein 646 n=1 Tax=Gasterosteus aculeatus TaxID=69293 RepID=G3P1Q5_GASAC
ERKFKCDECGRGYRHAGSLANHKKTHEVGSFRCNICAKENSNALALKSHLRSHTYQKKYSCAECGKAFRLATQLTTHQRVHLARPYRCDLCDKSYIHHRSLTNHKKTHQVGMFECTVCFKLFNNMAALYSHQRTHKHERPFRCRVCGKSYRHSGSLINHKRSHQVGIYQCSICRKSYPHLAALKSHLRLHKAQSASVGLTAEGDWLSSEPLTHDSQQGCFSSQDEEEDGATTVLGMNPGNGVDRSTGALYHIAGIKSHSCPLLQQRHSTTSSDYDSNLNFQSHGTPASSGPSSMSSHEEMQDMIIHQVLHKKDQVDDVNHINTSDGGVSVGKEEDASSARSASTTCWPSKTISGPTLILRVSRHTCHECGKAFKNERDQARCRNAVGNFKCQTGFVLLSTLQAATGSQERAIKSEDTGDPRPFACDQCGRTYRHAGSLVNHRNSHKTGEYYCSVCNNTYSNQLAMKNHLRTHFAYKKHSCQNCRKGFRGKKQLLAHVCDKEERPFTCSICDRSYRHAGSLLNHKNTHKTGSFSCSFCSKPFTNPMALRNHTRIHTQKKKYACLTCGKAFRLASILHNHQRVHSRVASQFSCPACDKSFQGRSGLKRHRCRRGQENSPRAGVQQSERGDKCFMCDLCGRSYRHAGSLLNHKKTHSENLHHCTLCLQTFPDPLTLQIHSMMRRHCCPECGKTFCLVAHLQSHMEVHSKDQSVVCSPCQQSFPNAASYQQHQDTRHGEKSHACEHCGRTYRHAGSLLNHKNSHKTGSFFCSVCQKEFTNLMALKNHRRIHTEPKRYQCLECGKAFRVSTQLICHRRIHTKEKPFACPLCDKSFSSKSNLRHHQKMHQNSQNYDSSFSTM